MRTTLDSNAWEAIFDESSIDFGSAARSVRQRSAKRLRLRHWLSDRGHPQGGPADVFSAAAYGE
jgi:hypothetical protein